MRHRYGVILLVLAACVEVPEIPTDPVERRVYNIKNHCKDVAQIARHEEDTLLALRKEQTRNLEEARYRRDHPYLTFYIAPADPIGARNEGRALRNVYDTTYRECLIRNGIDPFQ